MPDPKTLTKLSRKHQALLKKVGQLGPVLKGSVSATYTRCGKANCRCQADPPQLHGPYWLWSSSVDGKTVSLRLSDKERNLYQEWVENRKRLEAIIQDMHTLALDTALALKTTASRP
jgi:hypothetical protein